MAADRTPDSMQSSQRLDTPGQRIYSPSHPVAPLEPSRAPVPRPSRRASLAIGLAALLLVLIILPPYLSVSRYQRRIVTSMSQVLGRPVHLDHVAIQLLPFPAFNISNLVIDELPPFGDEPIIRANTVSARLRFRSLWLHRVEFSRITFTDPSINLVRNPDGRWNLESFLLQASHINAAPTAQTRASSAPRFPYIEATGARINLKLAQRKTPFSLTEAELALWLPEPQQWKLRLRGRPVRTDTGATDTGLLQTEATLERAGSIGQVPLTLDASWIGAPLGEASRVLTGSDAGLRGTLVLTTHVAGVLDAAQLDLELKLNGLHRADLIPDRLVDIDLNCHASTTHLLHTLTDVHCLWPLPESTRTELLHPGAAAAQFTLAGSVPDLLTPASAHLGLTAEHIPADTLLTWARATTGRLAPDLHAAGELNGTATWPGPSESATAELDLTHLALSGAHLGSTPITFANAAFHGTTPYPGSLQGTILELAPTIVSFARSTATQGAVSHAPVSGPDPNVFSADTGSADASAGTNETDDDAALVGDAAAASSSSSGNALLSGSATARGYSAHLAGLVPLGRLLALGADVPSFGAGLAPILPTNRSIGPTRVDLTVHRLWGAVPTWTNNLAPSSPTPSVLKSPAPAAHKSHRQP